MTAGQLLYIELLLVGSLALSFTEVWEPDYVHFNDLMKWLECSHIIGIQWCTEIL